MSEYHKLDNERQVFFYEQDFYVLSNFSAFTLQWKGHRFDTSEAAYHWEKFEPSGFMGSVIVSVRQMIRTAPFGTRSVQDRPDEQRSTPTGLGYRQGRHHARHSSRQGKPT
jgi:hypothetical protein